MFKDVKENCPVEKILLNNNKIIGVQTEKEIIECNKVVICAGAWGDF